MYACRRCNLVKSDQTIADPIRILQSEAVRVAPDGELVGENLELERLVLQLDLNSPLLKQWRVMWMRIVDLANERDKDLYYQLTGFPIDLPNLALLKPIRNSRPEGVEMSWYAKRERGLLPESY